MKRALSLTVLSVAKCTRQDFGWVSLRSSFMKALLNGGKRDSRGVLKQNNKKKKLDCAADHVSSSFLEHIFFARIQDINNLLMKLFSHSGAELQRDVEMTAGAVQEWTPCLHSGLSQSRMIGQTELVHTKLTALLTKASGVCDCFTFDLQNKANNCKICKGLSLPFSHHIYDCTKQKKEFLHPGLCIFGNILK